MYATNVKRKVCINRLHYPRIIFVWEWHFIKNDYQVDFKGDVKREICSTYVYYVTRLIIPCPTVENVYVANCSYTKASMCEVWLM